MAQIKNPEQVAKEILGDTDTTTMWSDRESGWVTIKSQIAAAIEADRAQRNLIECIAEALDDRGAEGAAQLVRDTDPDDDLWNNYVGPMLDEIEADYTLDEETAR
jgi:hypothetical protein